MFEPKRTFILDGRKFNIVEIGTSHRPPILIALHLNIYNESGLLK